MTFRGASFTFSFMRKHIFFSILTFIVISAIATITSAEEVKDVVLDNGLKVLLLEDHKSPAVTFQVWYRVGSRNEKDGKSGLSHFLEHMMFKGTPKTGPEEYARIIAKNGGRSNAFTTADVTVYFATMSRDKIGIEINLEADRMANASLGATYFEPEKKVIEEERRLRTEDQPISALAELTSAMAYLVHPYRRPVVGWMQDIQHLTRQDLVDHYRLYYTPNNAFIVVTGDFVTAEILQQIKTAFGPIPRGPEPPKIQAEELPQKGERRAYLEKEAELPFVLMYYHTPNLKSPDSYALDLLTVILAGGRSSRMYHELVYQKRLARRVDADYDRLSIDPTVFTVTAQLLPGIKAAEVEHEIDGIVEKIQAQLVSERELQKAKNQIEAAFVFGRDSIFGQAVKIGFYEAAGNWRLMDEYLAGIKKLTREDVRRVAIRYLERDRRTVGILIPRKEKAQ